MLHTNAGAVLLCCQVVHSTVQLTYALIFGTFGPMLQSVFNLAVLYQREFQLCQSVLCTIAGALTVRNFDRDLGILTDILRDFGISDGYFPTATVRLGLGHVTRIHPITRYQPTLRHALWAP